MTGLGVSVGGGYISRIIFEHGQKGSSSTDSFPSSSSNGTSVSPNSFYDNQTPPISTYQDAAPASTSSFYYDGGSRLTTFSDTDTLVASNLATSSFYKDGLPLTGFPHNATSASNDSSDAPIDDVYRTTSYDGDSTTLLDSVVDALFSSFY
ncbi:hypothetical protein Csa_020679 [Cucumis sativus]|uniref:Uncharacterized protein n=1 Tax=Cucumis sativus TaxID=3659 RepID=A0A0A0KBV2_CUCSA|nr:hypothetical protein Csa_020679 [Cucumis sativus]